MLPFRLSASSYSNTAPLIWSFLYGTNRGRYELVLDNAPARSSELLAGGRVNAALVPIIEFQRIADAVLVPDVCVGAADRVRSVCLVTTGSDLSEVRSVALDTSSRTSVALTRIVFREFLGFDPTFTSTAPDIHAMLAAADCALLIGDPALAVSETAERTNARSHLRCFDLAELWHAHTGLGFIFAMWMVNRSSAEAARSIDFSGARDEGLRHLDEIIANYSNEIRLDRDAFQRYLGEIVSYRTDKDKLAGLELFFKLAAKHGLVPQNRPLEFA